MSESELDRNEAATPHKLLEARERGQVAKSAEVAGAIVFVSAMVYLNGQGWSVWQRQFLSDRAVLLQAARPGTASASLWMAVEQLLRDALSSGIPFFAVLLVAAVAGNLIQTGAVFSFEPMRPDWSRLNPVEGWKRSVSWRTLFIAFRALLKLCLLGCVSYWALKGLLPQFFRLANLASIDFTPFLLQDLADLGIKLAAVLGLIALLDLVHSRRDFAKKMRMSRRDIKDESKTRDGDPRIRARLRELRREMLKRSLAIRQTRRADVVITNPTHVAVALRYVHGEMASPRLIAKGRGVMALAMRKIAARYRIPVVQSPSLARALYRDLGIDQHVQPTLYAPVARIIVWVFARRDATRAQAARGAEGAQTWSGAWVR